MEQSYQYRKKCCVPGKRFVDDPQIRYFTFPRDDTLNNNWLAAVNNSALLEMPQKKVLHSYNVCQRHFQDNQFQTEEKLKLNRGTIPTVHLSLETDSQCTLAISCSSTSGLQIGTPQRRNISVDASCLNTSTSISVSPVYHTKNITLQRRNNNASTKEGLQWRGRINGHCNGDGCTGIGGDSENGTGLEGSAGSGPDKLEGPGAAENDALHLKRRVGLISGVALIVGTMIGSGIFVSPSGLLERTGSIGMSFVIWMACGLLSLLGALAYAELGTMNTSSGAEYAYFMDAFGAPPAFLFSWASTLVLKPSQMAIICLSFGKYAVEGFVTECEPPEIVVKLVAVLIIVVILYVNCFSVNLATSVQNVFTAAKLVAVLIVILGGVYKICEGNVQHLRNPFKGTVYSVGNIATAFYTGLWAYDGWNNLNYVTEEIKNPSKNLPRSIIIGIPLVTICYALINISYLTVMSPLEMMTSEAVAVTFGNRLLGVMAWLMPLSVTVSTFGSANGTLFAAGRLCFAASREGHLLDILSYVHIRRYTPAPGLIFHSIIASAMVLYGTIDSLIDFFSFTAWIFYGGAMLALIVMRFTKPTQPRPYKVPIFIPVLVLLISIYLVIGPIIDKPTIEYLYAALFILGGMIFYVPFVHFKLRFPFMDGVTVFLQMLLEVAPTAPMFE